MQIDEVESDLEQDMIEDGDEDFKKLEKVRSYFRRIT